jgi:hypothetical protein
MLLNKKTALPGGSQSLLLDGLNNGFRWFDIGQD